MEQARGVLYLTDAAGAGPAGAKVLRLQEGENWLPRAQGALWELRRSCAWVCLAAEEGMAGLALALAAQLPVDRVALVRSAVFARRREISPQRRRLERFARRNLALVAAELLLLDVPAAELRGMLSILGQDRLCALDGAWRENQALLRAPWAVACEKNLLLAGNRV